MTQYFNMLKKDIIEFVMNTQYKLLVELQSNSRRRDIELETQAREGEIENHKKEKMPISVQS